MASRVTHIYEFLYRGAVDREIDGPHYHVQLGGTTDDPLTGKESPWIGPQMSAEQAEAAGWPLTRLVQGVNVEALEENSRLREELTRLRAAHEETSTNLESTRQALNEHAQRLSAVFAALKE